MLQLFQPNRVLLDQYMSFGGKRGSSFERGLVVTQTGIYCVLRNIGLCSVDAEMTAFYQNWTMFKEAQMTAIKACINALLVSARAESQLLTNYSASKEEIWLIYNVVAWRFIQSPSIVFWRGFVSMVTLRWYPKIKGPLKQERREKNCLLKMFDLQDFVEKKGTCFKCASRLNLPSLSAQAHLVPVNKTVPWIK